MLQRRRLRKVHDGRAEHGGEVFFDAVEAQLHTDAYHDGGIACYDDDLLQRQREAIKSWMKKLGKRILSGNFELMNTPMPVKIFEPRSYLQKLTDVWVYPQFLERAAVTSDALERMKWTITWCIAGWHHSFERWSKPFNPILGETWQGRQSSGARIALEQISHHPPVSAFQLTGPGGAYSFYGTSQPKVTPVLFEYGFKTVPKGDRFVEFANGGKIQVFFPSYLIKGVVNSNRPRGELIGTARFIDESAGLTAEIRFGPVEGSRNALLSRSDSFEGTITTAVLHARSRAPSSDGLESPTAKLMPPAHAQAFLQRTQSKDIGNVSKGGRKVAASNVVSSCRGSWLSHLDFDGMRLWTLAAESPDRWQAVPDALPSDCGKRPDLQALLAGDVKMAQKHKDTLEDLQRTDKKLRKGRATGHGAGH